MSKKSLKQNMLNRYGNTKISQMNTDNMIDLEAGYEANYLTIFKSFEAYKQNLSFIGKMYVTVTDNIRSLTSEEMKTIDKYIEYYTDCLSDKTLSDDMKKFYNNKRDEYVQKKIDIAENDKNRITKLAIPFTVTASALSVVFCVYANNTKENTTEELKNDQEK